MTICLRGQRKRFGKIWQEVLDDVEARNAFTKSMMWRSTDFLRKVVGEKEGRGAITPTCVCEHCNLFPVADFLWWVSANHGEKKKETKNSMSEWWCGACGMPCDWPGNGVVHHSHETCLLRGITFSGKCVAWRTSAPRLLTKA